MKKNMIRGMSVFAAAAMIITALYVPCLADPYSEQLTNMQQQEAATQETISNLEKQTQETRQSIELLKEQKKSTEENKKTKFSDIAGMEEVKNELEEIIDYLKDPEKYKKV